MNLNTIQGQTRSILWYQQAFLSYAENFGVESILRRVRNTS